MNEGEFITKFNETILNFKKKKKRKKEKCPILFLIAYASVKIVFLNTITRSICDFPISWKKNYSSMTITISSYVFLIILKYFSDEAITKELNKS